MALIRMEETDDRRGNGVGERGQAFASGEGPWRTGVLSCPIHQQSSLTSMTRFTTLEARTGQPLLP